MKTTLPPDVDDLLISDRMLTDPYPVYEQIRSQYPVAWSPNWQAWVVSPYEQVKASLKDKENLSNERRQEALFQQMTPEEASKLKPLRHYFNQKDVIGSDPPDHTRMRALVQKAFSVPTIRSLEPRIHELTTDLVSEALSSPSFDFIEQIAHPLPVILIAEILGAPPEDRPLFKKWLSDILGFQGTGTTTLQTAKVSQNSLLDLFEYMEELIQDRKRNPQEDIISTLALTEVDGEGFSRDELLATCNTILTAGHETTTNLLGNLLHLLLTHHEEWAKLTTSPANIIPGAIEEALRFEAPKQRNFRRIRKTHPFAGETLREGELVFQLIGAANRDPAVFSDPNRFDVSRKPNRHLAFGFDIHLCLGASLARLEAKVVLETLLRMAPNLEQDPTVPVRWQERVQFRGPGILQVKA